MELKFTHIGFSNILCTNKVKLIIPPHQVTGRRHTKRAKEQGVFIDATCGRQIKSTILLDDGTVISCALNPKTVMGRLMSGQTGEDWEENNEIEGEQKDG